MAIMWPRKLPVDIESDILRTTECRVYRQLQSTLPDPFVVFYSSPWLGMTYLGEEIDGECDFLIAHPDIGILALEVKGGSVAYNPKDNSWTTRDRWGIVHRIKDPVNQARSSKYQILKKLQRSPDWTPRHIRGRHGVILPDSERPKEDLGMDKPLSLFCFLDDFEKGLRRWIQDRFGEKDELSFREYPLGQDGLKALEDLLAYPFRLHAPIGNILANDDMRIETLTRQQFHILTAIQEIPRAAISGGAGTGKTVLAIEEAIQRADDGKRVLLTCYNRPLAIEMYHQLQPWKEITVATFHELCVRFASDAGIAIPDDIPYNNVFSEKYPAILIQALKTFPNRRFDAIIVDEGQDFLPLWLSALNTALSPEGIIRIFYDSNQSVYNNLTALPADIRLLPIKLSLNMRNTRRIHAIVQAYYRGSAIRPIGPEGINIEWIAAESARGIYSEIDRRIHQLISDERIKPADITVLMASIHELTECAPNYCLGGMVCRRADNCRKDSVTLDTIRRFKGLESRVVILAATPRLIGDRELIYVGLSRARAHLIVVGNTSSLRNYAIQK